MVCVDEAWYPCEASEATILSAFALLAKEHTLTASGIPIASIPSDAEDTEGICAVVWHLLVSHPMLQRAGTIGYSRGVVTIEDRGALEGSACECYQVVKHEFQRLSLLSSDFEQAVAVSPL